MNKNEEVYINEIKKINKKMDKMMSLMKRMLKEMEEYLP